MEQEIVARIKTGRITNVIPYGYSSGTPAAPYVIVRLDPDLAGRGESVRIITHMLPGQNASLREYVRKDLSDLLDDYAVEDSNGNYNQLMTENDFTGIVIGNDDGTISMERRFLLPSMIF
jgi:hypothetical protein